MSPGHSREIADSARACIFFLLYGINNIIECEKKCTCQIVLI